MTGTSGDPDRAAPPAVSDPAKSVPTSASRVGVAVTHHRERLLPAAWIWAAVWVIAVLAGLVAFPFGPTPSLVTTAVTLVILVLVLVNWSPVIGVADGELIAGRAHVAVGFLGDVMVLDATEMRQELGPRLNVRAYLCIRGWISTGVRVRLTDPDDPTPYWLISSRHPGRLAAAIEDARRAGRGAE